MEVIELTNGLIVFVDDIDYDFLLSMGVWAASGKQDKEYAVHHDKIGMLVVCISMSRVVMERILGENIPDGLLVDHKNRNTLDNRRENLRLATKSQNAMNSELPNNNTSGYKGIDYRIKRKQWRARITVDGSVKHLGWFQSKEDAIKAREAAEMEYYKEFVFK